MEVHFFYHLRYSSYKLSFTHQPAFLSLLKQHRTKSTGFPDDFPVVENIFKKTYNFMSDI